MSIWSRIAHVFRPGSLDRELEEELQSHIDEAVENGRDPEEARRAFGRMLQTREQSRDIRIATWLDSLRADAVFGWRQIVKRKVTSGAAIVSLALAIGACTSAFRLVDAMLLRPLPVSDPGSLFVLNYEVLDNDDKKDTADSFEYPLFRQLRAAAQGQAELMAISYAGQVDLTFGTDQEMEKAYRQYVSGWTFETLGLRPELGRLLTANDDVKPGGHPYAVLSHDFWKRRFGGDRNVIGRTFRQGTTAYEVVGVLAAGFTGTETGTMTDVFVPTMMNAKAIDNPNWSWFRTWVRLQPGVEGEQVRQKLRAAMLAARQEKAKEWKSPGAKHRTEQYLNAAVTLESAAAGVSGMQRAYRRSMIILGVLVALVLLIACANVANLLTAQATARAREMALRVSIGAGRARLLQLVLMESALLAIIASVLGGLFAAWSAPFVVSMINPPDNPARLVLPADWRVLGFAVVLTLAVTVLFGLAPALRASSVKPASALKGGEDPHSKRRLMHALVAAQVAFCFLVHFVAGMFVSSFDRLANQPVGFSTERIVLLDTVAKKELPQVTWDQALERLRAVAGVESAALASWPLMSGNFYTSGVWANGHTPDREQPVYFLGVSPGWLATMKIPLLNGREFRRNESNPDFAIVNEAFARRYFNGQDPVGRTLETSDAKGKHFTAQIVGLVRDARYGELREAIRPTVYIPFASKDENGAPKGSDWGAFIVRTATKDPLDLATVLRREVANGGPELRVSDVSTQAALIRSKTLRERMLSTLSMFFAAVALLLASVGLYGVLDYSVIQRQREIGIRLALGARSNDIMRRVTTEVFSMLIFGAFIGLALGIASERYVETLLFEVKALQFSVLLWPTVTILGASVLAALPPVFRAVHIDPSSMLRSE
ncbi:ADOP family duplicated permease [Paludibaculum fermentans]|uniref:ABC transporter permease n=1 Tax=Paludibaculum fermentans TaxID=1473598 RepID=UPI003EBAB21B